MIDNNDLISIIVPVYNKEPYIESCIESVLLKKSEPDYWEKGNTYTDRFIKLWITSIFGGDE